MIEKLLGENSELSAEVKASIVEAFDSAVQAKLDETFEVKVSERALELVEAKESEYNKYLEETEATYKKEAEELKNGLVESIDAYLEQFVSEMVAAAVPSMEKEIEEAKAKAIVETFEKLGLSVNIQEKVSEDIIGEAKAELSKELEDLKAKFNEAMNENISLKSSISNSKREDIIKEASKEMTEIQKEKFLKLVETFGEDSDFESFSKKVNVAVDSLTSAESKKEAKDNIVESADKNKSKFTKFL